MGSAVEIRARGPGFAVGVWCNLVLVSFSTTPSEVAAEQMAQISLALARQHADGIGMVHMVDTTHGAPPGAAARAHYIAMLRALNDHLLAGAVIASGAGFVSSIVRSILAGFTIAARPRFPLKVFPAIEPCSAWLGERLALSAEALLTALQETRAAMGAVAPA